MDKLKDIAILNLSSELPKELRAYFQSRGVNLLESGSLTAPTHILIDGTTNLKEILTKYQGSILISLSQPVDIALFYKLGGSLVVDKSWLKDEMGSFILDKFFQENTGINLSDKFPNFQHLGSFIVSNPYGTGDYLDRLVYHAFSSDHGAISIRSYFDNVVMFLATLRDQGKISLPVEVSYGASQDVFGIQLQFNTLDLNIKDVSRKFKSQPSRKNEEYLLYHAIHSTGFFDFTILESINKAFVTSLWTKGERIDFENKGSLFTTLKSAQAIANIPEQGITSFITSEPELLDFIDVTVEPMVEVIEQPIVISGGESEEEVSQTIKGSAPEKEQSQIVKGMAPEEEVSHTIKGSKEQEKITAQVIKGTPKEETNTVYKISAAPKEEKKDLRLSSSPEEKKTDNFMAVKSLGIQENEFSQRTHLHNSSPNTTISGPSENEKALDLKVRTLSAENERNKTQMKMLMSEIKIVKESRNALAEQLRGEVASEQIKDLEVSGEDKESMLLNGLKSEELKTKRLLIECAQKDTLLNQEIDKSQKQVKAKELILEKSKEVFNKMIERKDYEIENLNQKIDDLNKLSVGPQLLAQQNTIKKMEKQNSNLTKMIDMYKAKVTSMATSMQKSTEKTDEEVTRDENRKLSMINTQLKNQLEVSKKDIARYQEKVSLENSALLTLKKEKAILELQLKKANINNNKDNPAFGVANAHELEIKKLLTQVQFSDSLIKDQASKIKELEAKFSETSKLLKNQSTTEDPTKKAIQLEMNVKKLTQDLVESRNQLTEMKKETIRLRQEKVGFQNMMVKMKKDADKEKGATPKKGNGGKAA